MVPSLGLKVLYVEDDLDIQEALREVLEFAGYQVSIASTATAGLEALRNLEKLLAQYEPSHFLLQVVDLSRERPASPDEDRIAFTPTLVKRTPGPRLYLLGSLEHIQAVEDLLSDAKVERR